MKINTFKDNCNKFETFDVYKVIQKERRKGVKVNQLLNQILIINRYLYRINQLRFLGGHWGQI